MRTCTAKTSRRLTFQPVDHAPKARAASVPAGMQVSATCSDDGRWRLLASIDNSADYECDATPDDFEILEEKTPERESVDCMSWCSDGEGHYAGDDAYCTGKEMRIELEQKQPTLNLGGHDTTLNSIMVHSEHHHEYAGESGVLISVGDLSGLHLTDSEALRLSAMLMNAVHQRMPAVIPQ